jgi:hypothetical protein
MIFTENDKHAQDNSDIPKPNGYLSFTNSLKELSN